MSAVEDTKRRIIVGIDGSESSRDALRSGARIAAALHCPLEAISVWVYPPVFEANPPVQWELQEDAQRTADAAGAAVFGADLPAWFTATTRRGSPARVLIEESAGAEMLVLGSRGHGGFMGMLLGSVSTACVHHAQCPVLIVRHGSTG
jgi:Universal stress protein UspA and related nucleotide-binding proteins